MRVIKNINNNVSLCVDKQGRQLIAFGKGIGFMKPPYEIPLDQIETLSTTSVTLIMMPLKTFR